MQQIHLVADKYLTFRHAQQTKIGNPSATSTSHLHKYKQQNPKNEPYNMFLKLTQLAQIRE